MIVGHLVGVWLLTATWVNVGDDIKELSEPLEIRTFDTQAECIAFVEDTVSLMRADQDKLRALLGLMPGANAITLQCTKQAVEM